MYIVKGRQYSVYTVCLLSICTEMSSRDALASPWCFNHGGNLVDITVESTDQSVPRKCVHIIIISSQILPFLHAARSAGCIASAHGRRVCVLYMAFIQLYYSTNVIQNTWSSSSNTPQRMKQVTFLDIQASRSVLWSIFTLQMSSIDALSFS